MSKRVSALFERSDGVETAVRRLADLGYHPDDISVVTKNDEEAQAPENTHEGMATGGVLGAATGLILGLGAFSVPGLGFLAAAGPIASFLTGAAAGGLLGSLADFGFSEDDSARYTDEIHKGNSFLTVAAMDGDEEQIADLLKISGAYRVDIH